MFNVDDEDASLKTQPVRPNDVLDIEVSPVSYFPSTSSHAVDLDPGEKSEIISQKAKNTKEKRDRVGKSSLCNSKQRKRHESPMKQGDPFLPSVISDENPFVDYPVRKASRKKPSDCKCKGSGYNLSPSALLPEEMRQQWGVGVFGKSTPPKPKATVSPCPSAVPPKTLLVKDGGGSSFKVNTTFSEQPGPVVEADSCPICLADHCACGVRPQDGFRIPEKNDKRLIKTRSINSKNKESRNSTGSKNNSNMIKRIACYSYKENSNIISTSHFNKYTNSAKSFHENSFVPVSFESSYFKASHSHSSTRMNNHIATLGSMDFNKPYGGRNEISITPKSESRNPLKPRRILANITPSPSLSNSASHLSSMASAYESSKSLSRAAKQMMLIGGKQSCSCPSCRRPNPFLTRMEALGFTSGPMQHNIFSPIVFPTSQRYNTTSSRSSFSPQSSRYAPYVTQNYSYSKGTDPYYVPPPTEIYRSTSPTYDYSSPFYRSRVFNSTPLSLAQEMNRLDNSYSLDDNEISETYSSDESKDITDMSIKDTVDFFVGMKSPFITSSPSALSDTGSGGIYSSMSPEEESFTTGYSGSTYPCPIDICPTYPEVQAYRDYGCGDQQLRRPTMYTDPLLQQTRNPISTPRRIAAAPPRPLLYSSLVCDLEGELKSAIENIPTD